MERKRGDGGLNARMAAPAVPPAGGAGTTALVAGAGLPVSIAFNGLGQLTGPAPGWIELSHVRLGSERRLLVRIDAGLARICKPLEDCT
jgi:hypothetical protein